MAKAMRVGSTIIAYIGGKTYKKNFPVETILESYKQVLASSEEEALALFKAEDTPVVKQAREEMREIQKEAEKYQDILDLMSDVTTRGSEILEVKNNSLYVKGINITVPELLARKIAVAFKEGNEEYMQSLINFWGLCALNPDPVARHDLFKFLDGGKFTITKSGYFVAYRNAVIRHQGDLELVKFVTSSYLNIQNEHKNPYLYSIYNTDNGYKLISMEDKLEPGSEFLGNLVDLNTNLDQLKNTTEYTDGHTRTMSIKIGMRIKQDRNLCDNDPNSACSRGLHVGNRSFLSRGSFGNAGLICLVNPKNVVAVPNYDVNKMRTCEYLPIGVAEYDDNGQLIEIDHDVFEHELAQLQADELEHMSKLSEKELKEYQVNQFIAPDIDLNSLNSIYSNVSMSLEEANKVLENRML